MSPVPARRSRVRTFREEIVERIHILLECGDEVHLPKRSLITRLLGQSWARLSYGRFVEPFWLQTNEIDLRIPGLDPRLDGLRVLHLTDFHLCRRIPASHIIRSID